MTTFIALLRAVNVGGTGKLPMSELKALCEQAGFAAVRTYIASGNVVFRSDKSAPQVKAELESRLEQHSGKPIAVIVRTSTNLEKVLQSNPFPDAPPNRTVAIFLDEAPPPSAADAVTGQRDEQIRLGQREIYVFYPNGMGESKLKIPAASSGTARNMNTVAKLVELGADLPPVAPPG